MTKIKKYIYTDIDGNFREIKTDESMGFGFYLFSLVVGVILASAVFFAANFVLAAVNPLEKPLSPELAIAIYTGLGIFFVITIILVGRARLMRMNVYKVEFGWDPQKEDIKQFVKRMGITREQFQNALKNYKKRKKLEKNKNIITSK
ncbi:MAG: hypothetical protein ACP6IY_07985 [Promethearchaeia archaeon]